MPKCDHDTRVAVVRLACRAGKRLLPLLFAWTSVASAEPSRLSAQPARSAASAATPATCSDTPDPQASAQDLFKQGRCEELGGRLLSALELYRSSLPRQISHAAEQRVQARIDVVARQLASVRVDAWSLPVGASVHVAGEVVELRARRRVDPGTVVVEAEAPGFQKYSQTLELAKGEDRVLSISLTPEEVLWLPPEQVLQGAAPPSARLVPSTAPPERAEAGEASSAWTSLGWVSIAVGGSTLVAGGITGYLALKRAEYVQRECPNPTSCTPVGTSAARAGEALSTISTASFIAGAGLVVVGLAFLLSAPSGRGLRLRSAVGGLSVTGSM